MEYTTQEIIAKLMNMTYALEADGKWQDSSVLSQAVALLITQTNSAEKLRHADANHSSVSELRQVVKFISEQTL